MNTKLLKNVVRITALVLFLGSVQQTAVPYKNLRILNDDLVNRCLPQVEHILDGKLASQEIPRNFLLTSFSESRRILYFLNQLEEHADQEVCCEVIERINETVFIQFRQYIMNHRTLDQTTKLQLLGVIEKLHTAVGLTNSEFSRSEFSRMIIGFFQVRRGNWRYEDKLGFLAVVFEDARKAIFTDMLTNDEQALFIAQIEDVFVIKPRSFPWGKVGKLA